MTSDTNTIMESEVLERMLNMTLTTDEDEVMPVCPVKREKSIGRVLTKSYRKVPHNEANKHTGSQEFTMIHMEARG